MSETVASNAQLRVGHYSIGFGDRAGRRQTCFTQVLEPGTDNPWELDAVLAVTDLAGGEDGVVPGGVVLAALQDCLWLGPSRDDDLAYLIPELISRIDEQLRLSAHGTDSGAERSRPTLTLVLIKGRRYYAVREGEAPVYLLRNNTLRPVGSEVGRTLLPHANGMQRGSHLRGVRPLVYLPDEEPTVVSADLDDGDAIVVSNADLHLLLGDRDIRLSLLQASSPRSAAVRLAEETRQRGHHYVSVGVLFAGAGPSPVHRLRPASAAVPVAPPTGSTTMRTTTGGPSSKSAGGAVRVACIAGLVVGGLIGCGLTLVFHRPKPVVIATPFVSPALAPVRVDVGSPTPSEGTGASPIASTLPNSPPAASGPPAPLAASATPVSFVAPKAGASAPEPAPAVRPRGLDTPPSHTLAQGMSHKIALEILLDTAHSSLRITANQGAIFSAVSPQGVPAGEPLTVAIPADAPIPDYRSRMELRLLDRSGMPVPSTQGADMARVLQGPLHLSDLDPGEYRLGWWQPVIGSFQPIVTLRIAGP